MTLFSRGDMRHEGMRHASMGHGGMRHASMRHEGLQHASLQNCDNGKARAKKSGHNQRGR